MRLSPGIVTLCLASGLALTALLTFERQGAQRSASGFVNGDLVAYESSREMLTVRTENGDRDFIVHSGTPIHEGARTLLRADLTEARGCPAKIRYREADGQWIASDVRLSCRQTVTHTPSDAP
jgi:hypothetical protein